MIPRADSPEFAELAARWMDNTATDVEAELLWRAISERPECAGEFAAVARFESLLADTVKALDVEIEARRVLTVTPRTKMIPAPPPQPSASMRGFAMAAALVVLGLITAMLWPAASLETTKEVEPMRKTPVPSVSPPSVIPKVQTTPGPNLVIVPTPDAPPATEVTLTERLDGFFLNGVMLVRVPLSQALAILQQQLVQADYLKTLPLNSLHVTVPAGAAARRVTLQTASIPYLKAVRAVAALAGCDVQVEATSITLILQPGIFPQVTEKLALGELLAGRLTPDGVAMVEDADRVEALWEDAAWLGVSVMEDGSASISRGQWEALRQMTDSRDLLGLIPMPTFALYVVPEDSAPPEGLLTQEQLQQFQQTVEGAGFQPTATLTPDPSGAEPGELLTATVSGDRVSIGPQQISNLPAVRSVSTTLDLAGSLASVAFSIRMDQLTIDDAAILSGVQAVNASGSAAAIIAVPVQNGAQPTTPPAP